MKNLYKTSNLAEKLRDPRRVVLATPLLTKKLTAKNPRLLQVYNLELHLVGSENCNLRCWYCSTRKWGSGKSKTAHFFKKDLLKKITLFKPKAIILSGGEPTLYQPSPNFGFNEALYYLHQKIPKVKFGLITNGTIIPRGNWYNFCEWVRISIDSGSRETYQKLKKKDLFNTVIDNFQKYLQTNIPYVGMGYVYQKENFQEIFKLSELVFKNFFQDNEKRISIQFRPLIYYPKHLPSQNQKQEIKKQWEKIEKQGSPFYKFLLNNTNLAGVIFPSPKRPTCFKKCYLCLVHKAINSNGDVFPCCLTFKRKSCFLGNLERDSEVEILKNEKNFFSSEPCEECRFATKNFLLKKNLKRNLEIGQNNFVCPEFF